MPKTVPNLMPVTGKASLGFVGEAPGDHEEYQGVPFIGPTGQELSNWKRAVGIPRPKCFIGNITQYRPPKNKIEKFFLDAKCTRFGPEIQEGLEQLKADVVSTGLKCLVAVGGHALYALTGKQGITKWWGSVLPSTLIPGVKVVGIPHPSYVVRGMWGIRPLIYVWLRRAVEESLTTELRYPQRELLSNPTYEQVMEHLERLLHAPYFAFDIETTHKKPRSITHISFSDSPDWAICIPFVRARHHRWDTMVEMEILRAITRLFKTSAIKIAHNLSFDYLNIAHNWRICIEPPLYDTMIAHNRCCPDLTDEPLKHLKLNRLSVCTSIYTREPFYKDDFKEDGGKGWKGAEEEFRIYSCKDAAVTCEIYEALEKDIDELGVRSAVDRAMEVFPALAYMSYIGVKRDLHILGDIEAEAESVINETQSKLDEMAGRSINVKSPDMVNFLYVERDLPVQYHKKTGRPTTDETALSYLCRISKDPVLPLIRELRRYRQLKESFLNKDIGSDGRFRTEYNQAGTTSFRLASRGIMWGDPAIHGPGTNLQNQPSRPRPNEDTYNRWLQLYKQSFVVDEGMLMCKRDYIQAEAMYVAWDAGDPVMMEDFRVGNDIHCRTAEIVFDVAYKYILEGYKDGNPRYVNMRELAKRIRHAFHYLVGPRQLKDILIKDGFFVEERQCKSFLQAMRSNAPFITAWHAQVEYTVRRERVLVNALGSARHFFSRITHEVIRSAMSFKPQSTVAELLNIAIARVYNEMHDEVDVLLNRHDAIVFQAPEENIMKCTKRVGELMDYPLIVNGMELVIPSDAAIGKNEGELHKVEV